MSGGLRHAFSGALYERDDDGNVRVTDKRGRRGTFGSDGHWIEGELDVCDPQLCVWVSAQRLTTHHRLSPLTQAVEDSLLDSAHGPAGF